MATTGAKRARVIEVPRGADLQFYLMALVFLVFSFWNGLYFDQSFMAAAIYLACLVVFHVIWLRQNRLKISGWAWFDVLVLSYFAVYFLSACSPVHVEYAVTGVIRHIFYLLFYLLMRVMVSVDDRRKLFMDLLVISGVAFAVYGLANGFGTLHVNGAIFDTRIGRIAANFEYSNTYAIYQAVMYFFAVALSCYVPDRSKKKWLYEGAAYLMLASLLLTYSRGTWLVTVGMLALLVLITGKEYRGNVVLNAFIPLIPLLLTSSALSKAAVGQVQTTGWGATVAGAAGTVLLTIAVGLIKQKLTPKQWKMGTIGLGILFLGGAVFYISVRGLPQTIAQRIASINLQQFSAVQRFQFYKDGLKVLHEHPLLGAGPNAWAALWQRYQSYPYTSRQSHSVFMDVLMNVGIIGFLLFLAILVATIVLYVRTYWKEHARNRLIYNSLLIGFLALLGHGAIDFDFSYGSINFLLWAFIAMLLPKLTIQQESILARRYKESKTQKAYVYAGISISLIGAFVASTFLLSNMFLVKADASANNPQQAQKYAQNAVDLAPYRPLAWLINTKYTEMLYKQNQTPKLKNQLFANAKNAAQTAPHDPETLLQVARVFGNYGDGIQAADYARQAWENGRYHIEYPQQYLVFADLIGTQLYSKNPAKAKDYFEQALQTYQDVEQRIANFKNLPDVLEPEYPYELTPAMHLYAGESAYYLGQWQEAERILKAVSTVSNATDQDKLKAEAIMAAVFDKQGKKIDEDLLKQIQKNKVLYTYYTQLKKIEPVK